MTVSHVAGFARGQATFEEAVPHAGSFADGQCAEGLARRVGRFCSGQETVADAAPLWRQGSFADRFEQLPARELSAELDLAEGA